MQNYEKLLDNPPLNYYFILFLNWGKTKFTFIFIFVRFIFLNITTKQNKTKRFCCGMRKYTKIWESGYLVNESYRKKMEDYGTY